MANGEVCCILGVCCPPGSAEQRKALASELEKSGVCSTDDASEVAEWLLARFDLAPLGTVSPLIAHVATMAKGHGKAKGA